MHNVNANGASIPALGLGTWNLRDATARHMVGLALDIGYRHIDTAQMYGNEAEVGDAIAASSVARDDIFLTTKIWPDNFRDGDLQRAVEGSLSKLKVAAVDLLLLHWPSRDIPLAQTIKALNDVKRRGMARHIGVSNFTVKLLEQALDLSEEPLVDNQVEYHPFLSQRSVLAKCRAAGLALTAYCPIARGKVFGNATIEAIAAKHNKNVAQITLRWLLQQDDVIAIPRTSKEANARSNFEIFDFRLSDAEMAQISALADPHGRMVNVSGVAPDWDQD
jgi:diketogulonate reductase-like aldo/keto reductase